MYTFFCFSVLLEIILYNFRAWRLQYSRLFTPFPETNRYFVERINVTFQFVIRGCKEDEVENTVKKLNVISSTFSIDSNRVFSGCTGAYDDMTVGIELPQHDSDREIFCWKHFFAFEFVSSTWS